MISVGKVNITPIVEIEAGEVIQDIIEKATPEAIKGISWLQPNYADEDGRIKARVQSFVLEINGKKVLVDGCVGNSRKRSEFPTWGDLQTNFLERLSSIVELSDIDIVLCTHMHFDHVGWNTILVEDKWTPTFPNAQYIFCEEEFEYWKRRPSNEAIDDHNGFEESVQTIYEAGLAVLVPGDYKISEALSLIPTPGHTPGHVSILIESEGQQAVISGDAVHHPCQIAYPEWKTYDTDSNLANKTRQKLLDRFAGTGTLFIGSHFSEPVAGTVVRDGAGFRLMSYE